MNPIPTAARRSPLASRAVRVALLPLALVFLLVACVRQTTPSGISGEATYRLEVDRPVRALRVVLSTSPESDLVVARGLDGFVQRAVATERGRVALAAIAGEARGGGIAELELSYGGASVPVVVDVEAYGADGDPVAAVASVRRVDADPGAARRDLAAAGGAWGAPQSHDGFDARTTADFAEHPFGDLDRDDAVDVLDALLALDIATGALVPAPENAGYQAFHADFDADGDTDVDDVLALLDKVVDPELAARPVVAPTAISFVRLRDGEAIVVGNAGNLPLTPVEARWNGGAELAPTTITDGQTVAFVPDRTFGTVTVEAGTETREVAVGNLTLLVAGQSNAQGRGAPLNSSEVRPEDPQRRMLGNDYLWKDLYEPLDDDLNQVDQVSEDDASLHSFGLTLSEELAATSPRDVYLIPAAKGGSALAEWFPGAPPTAPGDLEARTTLFGSAVYRALVSAGERTNPVANPVSAEGGPVVALAWYQGESEDQQDERRNFIAKTNDTMDGFGAVLAPANGSLPVVYAQLSRRGVREERSETFDDALEMHLKQHDIAERQRRMETGALQTHSAVDGGIGELAPGAVTPRNDFFMVVTNDLPFSDHIHLSAQGQRVLGRRIALAVREHLLGETVDGTGPRLVAVEGGAGDDTVEIRLDRSVTPPGSTDYDDFFTVYDGAPDGGDIGSPSAYGTNDIEITDISLQNGDTIVLRLADAPTSTPYVRYMPPFVAFGSSGTPAFFENAVRGASVPAGLERGLPLPSFGPVRAQ